MKRSSIPSPSAVEDGADTGKRPSIYARISGVLRNAIGSGSIPGGAVLLEGPVADILHVTRTPVRQALRELEMEGHVQRFDGRGYLAGPVGVEPCRITLTADMLGMGSDATPVRKTLGWEGIYDEVERHVVHLSVFDQFRINEVEMARHFNVGRIVARDVLLRLESLGLVEKDERLRWVIKPLDDKRINHLFELRWLLEPAALRSAIAEAPTAATQAMLDNLRQTIQAYPKVSSSAMDQLETDLHVDFMAYCTNRPLLESLQRTRCIHTLSKHVLGATAPMPKTDPFMQEHFEVLEAAYSHDTQRAANALRQHLENSCSKVTQRAAYVRENVTKPHVRYIG